MDVLFKRARRRDVGQTEVTQQHGGRRKGAGRKPAPEKLVPLRGSYLPVVAAWLKAESRRRAVSLSSLLAEAGREYMERHAR